MLRALVCGVTLVVTSCRNPPQPAPSANANATAGDAKPSAATPSAADASDGDVRIYFDDGPKAAITIHEDGMIEFDDGTKPLRVTADGKVLTNPGSKGAQGGVQLVASIQADGSVTPDVLGATIHADGTASFRPNSILEELRGKTVSLDGFLLGIDPGGAHVKVEGASTPGRRRTAMLVLLAFETVLVGGALAARSGP